MCGFSANRSAAFVSILLHCFSDSQVIIEYLEDAPDASYEDLLNKIEVGINCNTYYHYSNHSVDHCSTSQHCLY